MSDTELLRQAARHIRYLAGDPVEWDADSHDWDTWEVREQDHRGWWSRLIAHNRRPTRALHIAAWDPKVAHLVADWLEAEAESLKYRLPAWDGTHWRKRNRPEEPAPPGHDNPDHVRALIEHHYRHPLAVARALSAKES